MQFFQIDHCKLCLVTVFVLFVQDRIQKFGSILMKFGREVDSGEESLNPKFDKPASPLAPHPTSPPTHHPTSPPAHADWSNPKCLLCKCWSDFDKTWFGRQEWRLKLKSRIWSQGWFFHFLAHPTTPAKTTHNANFVQFQSNFDETWCVKNTK